ncbi:MAG: peptidylprolyl isomerase, partial [Pseudomonadota bacterium]
DILARGRARRAVEAEIETIDDLLAGGATLEELAADTLMQIGEIEYTFETTAGIAAYEGFRRAAQNVAEDDFPEVISLDDGSLFALRLDGVIPPSLRPFDDVTEDVRAAWEETQTEVRLTTYAGDVADQLRDAATVETLGLPSGTEVGVTRRDFIETLPDGTLTRVFDMAPGEIVTQAGQGAAFVLRLDAALPPDLSDPALEEVGERIRAETSQGLSRDVLEMFVESLKPSGSIRRNDPAIAAVHSQFP